jgi:2-hydroxychromene-2-carboxylate isomerase
MTTPVIHYTDMKSPFAYLALADIHRIEDTYDVAMSWRHYTLHIEEYFGAVGERSERNWSKIRYLYQDARRLANRQGLTVFGPEKVYRSRIAGIAMLWAERHGRLRPYLNTGFECFFKRDFDLDSIDAVEAMLDSVAVPIAGFRDFLEGEGAERHDVERADADAHGVFGAPTLVLGDEIFWGGDRLWMLEERLRELGLAHSTGLTEEEPAP